MRIMVYAPLAVLGHHFETDLEIIQKHLREGDEVVAITCGGELKSLDFYACKGVLRCQYCVSRCSQGFDFLLNKERLIKRSLGRVEPIAPTGAFTPDSKSRLRDYNYNGVDVGSAYLSSLISDLRDPDPKLSLMRDEVTQNISLLQGLTDRFDALLEEFQPDRVYFFNGRFSIYRPLLRLCQKKGIDVRVHERGPTHQMYSITEGHMPHDIPTRSKEIDEFWADPKVSEDTKVKIASNWFEARAKGIMASWRSFADGQSAEEMPEGFDPSKRNIGFFVSSEDEFASVPGWEPELFSSQVEAVRYMCESFSDRPEFQFYIRMHPNVRGLRNSWVQELLSLGGIYKNCHILSPTTRVNSYTLLRHLEKTISFGSTMGIESVFWGVPSILLGKSLYMNLNAAVVPKSKAEFLEIIGSQQMQFGEKSEALKFSYWMARAGIDFEFYKPINLTTGKFNDHVITGSRALMWFSYAFVLLHDLGKILKGQYSVWHLTGKIKNKIALLTSPKAERTKTLMP